MKNFNKIFPNEITTDIFSRLPAESVLECKSVCKTWKNIIENPSFPQLHLARLNSTDSGKLRGYVFLKADDVNFYYDFYYFECNDNEDWNFVRPNHRKINLQIPLESYIFIGSFNGLICVYGTQPNRPEASGPAIVFNPVTREYVVLPDFDSYPEYETKGENSIEYHHLACGFGYLVETDEYKVVRIYCSFFDGVMFVEVEVYTLGSGNGWRNVGKFDLGFRFYTYWEHTHGVFVNGCLHWRNTEGGGMVVVFDLAHEKFRDHIPPPPMLTGTDDDEDKDGFIVIGVSGGGILYYAVRQSVGGQEFRDVWLLVDKSDRHVMREQIEHQSWGWSKATSLDPREPCAFMRRGTTVVRLDQGVFKTFLPRTSTWEAILNSDISRQVFRYKHTILSLKDLGEEDAEIMKTCSCGSSESDSD